MKKKMTVLLIAAMVFAVFAPFSAMAYDSDHADAGKYGELWGYNYGDWLDTTIDDNDGTGRLYNRYELQDRVTGGLYRSGSVSSSLESIGLGSPTYADDYPAPRTVFGTHEVRGTIPAAVYTDTAY